MGFCFPAFQSPGIHSTGRRPTGPREAVGERLASQPANATVLLAFGRGFFYSFCPLLEYYECIILLSSKEEKKTIES